MVEHFVCNEETRVRFTVGPFKPLKGLTQRLIEINIRFRKSLSKQSTKVDNQNDEVPNKVRGGVEMYTKNCMMQHSYSLMIQVEKH